MAASGHRYLGTEVWVQQADIDRFKAEIKEHVVPDDPEEDDEN